MALDSAIKRASSVNFGTPFYVCLPPPDGAVNTDDKQFTLNLYSSVEEAAGGAVAGAIFLPPTINIRTSGAL